MSRVYSTALIDETIPSGGVAEFPVPTNRTCVVRDILVAITSASLMVTTFEIVFNADTKLTWFSLPPETLRDQWQGRIVLPAGALISAAITSGDPSAQAGLIMSGYLLSLP